MRPFLSCVGIVTAACAATPVVAQHGAMTPVHRATAMVAVRGPVYGSDIVRTAKRFLGTPYVWGASQGEEFDCSGFVQYVFKQHGIALPRTAHEQAMVGDAPHPGDLQAGDLLFFWGGQGAQHIAIYVGGDTIIHASSRGGHVQFDRFSGSPSEPTWFGKRLIAVRRVLPADGVLNVPMTTGVPPVTGSGARPPGR